MNLKGTIHDMFIVKRKKNRKIFFLRISIFAILVYVSFILINNQMQLNQKKQELESLKLNIKMQDIKNEEIDSITNSPDKNDYLKGVARSKLDLFEQGSRVFVNVSGE